MRLSQGGRVVVYRISNGFGLEVRNWKLGEGVLL